MKDLNQMTIEQACKLVLKYKPKRTKKGTISYKMVGVKPATAIARIRKASVALKLVEDYMSCIRGLKNSDSSAVLKWCEEYLS